MDLEEVRLKEPDELTDDEKSLLKEHQDELSDEEKDAFKSVIETDDTDDADDDKPFKTFKTQEELDAFVKEQRGEPGPEPTKPDEGDDGDKPIDFFPEGYRPKTWNQFANDLLPKLKPVMRKETESYSQETKDKIAEINAQFDREIEQLRVIDPSIPAQGTPERVQLDKDLAKVALENKDIRSMTQAYSIYKKSKAGTNEGEDDKSGDDEEKQRVNLAKKIGGGGGGEGGKKKKKYSEIATASEEELWDAALRDLESGS